MRSCRRFRTIHVSTDPVPSGPSFTLAALRFGDVGRRGAALTERVRTGRRAGIRTPNSVGQIPPVSAFPPRTEEFTSVMEDLLLALRVEVKIIDAREKRGDPSLV